ncbi:MAG TPA: hypothetical protein VFC39_16400 [Acidobacteriaceae bacterium]|nr:hypothetical protein [Acidobacteriaceae bacterium]
MAKVEEVFGVAKEPVLSYVERPAVDDSFIAAIAADKQVVVYGASKQGKTALVRRYLPYEKNIVVQLTPRIEVEDVYRTILRSAGVQIVEGTAAGKTSELGTTGKLSFKALLPIFGGAEASAEATAKKGTTENVTYKEIPFNLSLPQDVSQLLKEVGDNRTIVLENFHYLNDAKQQQLAFDLRTYQELGVRFVILGVWREKNRLSQFNGDLLDRVHEVPVEPWLQDDFIRVARKGEGELNIVLGHEVLIACMAASFSSIGVFQELLKQTCIASGITETAEVTTLVESMDKFATAKTLKAGDYASRHERALESIATGNTSGGGRGDSTPLFLPYYLVRVICESGFEGLNGGMRRSTIHERIQAIHHRPSDVRASDMSNLLHSLAAMQAAKSISPPIIDYDQSQKLLQVVDSTFYFFLQNGDLTGFLTDLSDPVADYREKREVAKNIEIEWGRGGSGTTEEL